MKKIMFWTTVLVLGMFLSKFADETSKELEQTGGTMQLRAQKVVGCAKGQVMLESRSGPGTLLDVDASWPDCTTFVSGQYYDFLLGRGEKMKYISAQRLPWWRAKL